LALYKSSYLIFSKTAKNVDKRGLQMFPKFLKSASLKGTVSVFFIKNLSYAPVVVLFDEKTEGKKSRDIVSLNRHVRTNYYPNKLFLSFALEPT
jgi:hypothetical protein